MEDKYKLPSKEQFDELNATLAEMGNTLAKANDINTTVDGLSTRLDNESTARLNADANLQSLINDRYTKTETDTLVNKKQNKLSNKQLEAVNSGLTSDDKETLDGLDETVSDFDGRISTNESDIGNINTLVEAINGTGAGFHSSIYRGKYLGDTFTDDQKNSINWGTFDDMFVGDYWTINDVNWVIADFDYYYNVGGDTPFTEHHIVVVPDTILYDAPYRSSEMSYMNLDDAKSAFYNAFGEASVATHSGKYSNAINNDGTPSGYEWKNMEVELMSEEQVYGHSVWGHNGYDVGTQKTQFKLFTFDQTKINIGQTYWLTNVVSSDSFAVVGDDGCANKSNATTSCGVRPFACIIGTIQ